LCFFFGGGVWVGGGGFVGGGGGGGCVYRLIDRHRYRHVHTHIYKLQTHGLVCVRVCICVCVRACVRVYSRVYMCVCVCASAYTQTHTNTRMHTQIEIHISTHVPMYVHIIISCRGTSSASTKSDSSTDIRIAPSGARRRLLASACNVLAHCRALKLDTCVFSRHVSRMPSAEMESAGWMSTSQTTHHSTTCEHKYIPDWRAVAVSREVVNSNSLP